MSSEHNSNDNQNAFLIVDGTKVFAIDQDDFSIGRKSDNQIIIDDPHVSRYHAKIRMIDGKYILFDLESTVGTSVNGKRIQTTILKPGDVISIGGVPIIFGVNLSDLPPDASQPTDTNANTTASTDLKDLDQYLDMFDDKD